MMMIRNKCTCDVYDVGLPLPDLMLYGGDWLLGTKIRRLYNLEGEQFLLVAIGLVGPEHSLNTCTRRFALRHTRET